MVPVYSPEKFDTVLRFYNQNLHFQGEVELRILSAGGDVVSRRFLSEEEIARFNLLSTFDIASEVKGLGLVFDEPVSAFFGFLGNDMPFPSRFKLALNVKRRDQEFGSNICFSPLVQRGKIIAKPFARRCPHWVENRSLSLQYISLGSIRFHHIGKYNPLLNL